ncbi:MAG: alpha/beta fold hydrolase [Kangiellaceae bacterium]|nr:alpha/beta fold hydrolase [Kangiellaceae bacterium]
MSLALATYRLKNRIFSSILPSKTAHRTLNRFIRPRRSELKEWEKQAEAKGNRFKLNDQISAITWSSEVHSDASEKTLLLVHGWESRATQMYGIVPKLLELGYRVTAVDMPAHGHSGGDIAHAPAFIDTVLLAQDKLGKFDAVVGHSMGAGASGIALSHGLQTEKLVLISGPSSVENVLRRFSRFVGLNQKATEKFISHAEELVGRSPSDLDTAKMSMPVSTTTLVIHDALDREVPISESQRILAKFNNVEFFTTEGFGHRKILKADSVKNKISHFLND